MPTIATLLPALLQGFGVGAGLIIAIGAQNAFVLRQGLKQRHVFATAAICTLCDMTLIALGVGGMGSLVTRLPVLSAVATWGGAAFLVLYGARSFRAALAPGALSTAGAADPPALRATLLAALGFSLLNPHVYLDTVVLIGSVGARFPPDQRVGFAAGAMLASTVWFFGLAYGAAQLAPLFRRPAAWRVLDVAVGVTMWAIAISLIRHAVR